MITSLMMVTYMSLIDGMLRQRLFSLRHSLYTQKLVSSLYCVEIVILKKFSILSPQIPNHRLPETFQYLPRF